MFISMITVAVLVYIGFCVLLYVTQRSLIYLPQARDFGAPDSVMTLNLPDAKLQISLRERAGPGAVIYFGGNAEDVSANLGDFGEIFPDRALYLMHYRGYGGSSGSPSEKALNADALGLYDYVSTRHKDIVVIGRSLGSGVAIRLAAERPVSRLILVTPYHSLEELAVQQFPFVPVRWMLRDRFDAWSHAAQINAPTTIIVAENDTVIPRESAELLRSRFVPGRVTWKMIAKSGHNDISDHPDYAVALRGDSARASGR